MQIKKATLSGAGKKKTARMGGCVFNDEVQLNVVALKFIYRDEFIYNLIIFSGLLRTN